MKWSPHRFTFPAMEGRGSSHGCHAIFACTSDEAEMSGSVSFDSTASPSDFSWTLPSSAFFAVPGRGASSLPFKSPMTSHFSLGKSGNVPTGLTDSKPDLGVSAVVPTFHISVPKSNNVPASLACFKTPTLSDPT